jgi:HEAT repeat protein
MTREVRLLILRSRCLALAAIVLVPLVLAGKTVAAPEERPSAPIADLIKKLKDDDYSTRYRAAGELEELGLKAEPAISALIDALGDEGAFNTSNKDFVQWMATRTLLTIGPTTVPALMIAVKDHTNTNVRHSAMFVLAQLGGDGYPAIPVLQAAMRRDADRVPAALMLREIDPKEEWIVPAISPRMPRPLDALRRCLRQNNPEVRIAAIQALTKIGPAAKEAVPLLTKLTEDTDDNVRWKAVQALGAMKQEAMPAVPALLKVLRRDQASIRDAAAESLAQIAPREKDVALALAEGLKDTGANVPQTAARALAAMGPAAESAVPPLIEALKNPAVSRHAAEALGKIGPKAKAAVPALQQGMKDKDSKYIENLRLSSTIALGGIGPEARAAIPVLIEALADKNQPYVEGPGPIPSAAMTSLTRIGPAAVPALSKALKDARPKLSMLAAETLGRMGPASNAALPALTDALKDDRGVVRVEAALALWRIDRNTDATLPVLLKALPFPQGIKFNKPSKSNDPQTSGRACNALYVMGPAAKGALPKLIPLLKDQKNASLWCVLRVLRGMGPAAKPAVPTLAEVLKEEKTFRAEIAWTLGKIGADAEAAVPALIATLGDENTTVRWAAISALGRIGRAARPAAPALIRALGDPKSSVRASAAFALGQIDAAAEPAVAALAKRLEDEEPIVRWAAFTTLETFGSAAKDAVPMLGRLVGDRRGYIPSGVKERRRYFLQPKRPDVFGPWPWGEGDAVMDMAPARDAYNADRPVTVPERAIRILAALGPAAREAVPALLAARCDERVTVRLAADAALKKIDPAALDKAQPSRKEMERLWDDLGSDNEVTAYQTLWTLVIAPRPVLPWLRERLRPVAPPPPERTARLIRDLDDETFAVRAKATKELEELGELAEPALRTALEGKPSLEVRRRVEQLLKRLDEQMPTPERLRTLRAIAVLERIGTAEARELLRSLAKGAAGASPTREAKSALRRLDRGTLQTSP